MTEKHIVSSTNDLHNLADILLKKYPNNRIFCFNGGLGAGKTTFIKAICQYLGVVDNVSSPTFAIINEYRTNTETEKVFHFDLYRIKKEEELLQLGVEDYFYSGNYCFIEWHQIAENLLPDEYVLIDIETVNQDVRNFIF